MCHSACCLPCTASGKSSSRQAESVVSTGAQSGGSGAPLSTSSAHLPVVVSFDLPFSTSLTATSGTATGTSSSAHAAARNQGGAAQVLLPPAGSGLPSFALPVASSHSQAPYLADTFTNSFRPSMTATSTWSNGNTLTSLTNPAASTLFGNTLGFEQASSEPRSVASLVPTPASTAPTYVLHRVFHCFEFIDIHLINCRISSCKLKLVRNGEGTFSFE